jgi:hypothetical protein
MKPIGRDYLRQNSTSGFQAAHQYRFKKFATEQATYVVATTPVVNSTFPVSAPHLSSAGTHVSMVWQTDNAARTAMNRTVAMYSSLGSSGWATPKAIADDSTPDFSPVALTFTDGAVLAAWEDAKMALPDTATLDSLYGQLEISAAVFNPVANAWSAPVRLSSNSWLDQSPSLSGQAKNNVMLSWISNEQNDMTGSALHPNKLNYAIFNGTSWSTPAVAAVIPNAIKRYAMVYDGAVANVVFALDTDGDNATLADLELYRLTFSAGSWGALTRLTTDAVIDDNPQLALDANKHVVLTWLKGNELSSVVDFDFANRSIIRTEASYSTALADFRQAVASDGKVALIYAKRSENHSSDLFGVFYDAVYQNWGQPKQLTDDAETEQWPSIAFPGGRYAGSHL